MDPKLVLNDRVWLVAVGIEDKNDFSATHGSTDAFEERLCKLLRFDSQNNSRSGDMLEIDRFWDAF